MSQIIQKDVKGNALLGNSQATAFGEEMLSDQRLAQTKGNSTFQQKGLYLFMGAETEHVNLFLKINVKDI